MNWFQCDFPQSYWHSQIHVWDHWIIVPIVNSSRLVCQDFERLPYLWACIWSLWFCSQCLFELHSYTGWYDHKAWWLWHLTGLFREADYWLIVGQCYSFMSFFYLWSVSSFLVLISLGESLPQAAGSFVSLGSYEPLLASLASKSESYPDQVLPNFSYFLITVEY